MAGELAAGKGADLTIEGQAYNEAPSSEALAAEFRANDGSKAEKAEPFDIERRPGRDRSLDLEDDMEL